MHSAQVTGQFAWGEGMVEHMVVRRVLYPLTQNDYLRNKKS